LLREIDILVANNLAYQLQFHEQDTQDVFTCGKTCVLVKRPKGTPMQEIQVVVFTEIGRQLLQLIERKPADPDYIKKFASLFRLEGVSIQSGLIIERQGNTIEYINIQDVPAESN